MNQKVKITRIYKTDKDKMGNPLKNAKGLGYTRMSIKTEQHGDEWISGFENSFNKDWKEGDTVDVAIEKTNSKGKEYLNFKNLSDVDILKKEIADIKARLANLEMSSMPLNVETEDLTDEDIPLF
jgi:hypothetical protein